MTLIDDKKSNGMDILIRIKRFITNIGITLAVYILIFIIGSLTMFACNVTDAKYLEYACSNYDINEKNPIFWETYTKINKMYVKEEVMNNDETQRNIKEIFQYIGNKMDNDETLPFCVNYEENTNFGIFENCIKYTINFTYMLIRWYTTFLNKYISEINILWWSPFFSFLFFIFLVLISGAYFYYKIISISVVNIFRKVFTNWFNESWLLKLQQILISNIIILVTIILSIFGFVLTPVISLMIIIYTFFNILTQKLSKYDKSGQSEYGIFHKMADNLIYQKGYNIIIILILSIINVFLFHRPIGGIIFALIIIFYVIFYKKLILQDKSVSDFVFDLPEESLHSNHINYFPPYQDGSIPRNNL